MRGHISHTIWTKFCCILFCCDYIVILHEITWWVYPFHDDAMKWKHFPRYWPFVRGIHRSPVNSPHKGQWRGALMFSLICLWINNWVNTRKADDLRRYRAHYDVTVVFFFMLTCWYHVNHMIPQVTVKQLWTYIWCHHGPLARYVKLRVAHAPGMPGTFSPPPRFSDPDMHHGTCVTHVPWCMPGSLTSGFLWSWWWGKRSRRSRRMRNPQFYVSAKRPIPRHTIQVPKRQPFKHLQFLLRRSHRKR